jgi:hypothetical protein
MGIMKEVLEPSHVVYMHTERLPNGKPYTVEFHMVPGDSDADVYVVRDFDNHPLEETGFTIEDLEDWNLSEADHIDALFAEEMARSGGQDVQAEGEVEPSLDGKQYTFDRWFDVADKVSSGLKRPSLVDTVVCSGMYRTLVSQAAGSYLDEDVPALSSRRYDNIPSGVQAFLNRTLDFADKLTKKPLSVVDDVAALPAKAADRIVKKKPNPA